MSIIEWITIVVVLFAIIPWAMVVMMVSYCPSRIHDHYLQYSRVPRKVYWSVTSLYMVVIVIAIVHVIKSSSLQTHHLDNAMLLLLAGWLVKTILDDLFIFFGYLLHREHN